jgi:hypothetical protein
MTTIPHGPPAVAPEPHGISLRELIVPEMWACLAIAVMWLAVLFDAIYGPNLVTTTAGGDSSTIPSAIILALFAFLGTWIVARHGFGRQHRT